jgi:hypothetical protein
MAPGNEGINMPKLRGAQAVPLADLHWDQNGEGMNGINTTSSILGWKGYKGPKLNL